MTNQDVNNNEPEVFTIPSWNMERLEKELAKLNKRGAKLGVMPFELVIGETRTIKDPRYKNVAGGPYKYVPDIEVIDVHITGEGPKIDGWKFVGSLDHHSIPGEVMVKTVPGETIPPQYFHAEPVCDHCGHHRNRKDTFILQNEESGEYQQIGRMCTKDFIGHNPERVARLLTSLWNLTDSLDDEDAGWGYSGAVEYVYDSVEVLRWTIRAIKKFGWVSKSNADEDTTPTAGRVGYVINRPFNPSPTELRMWQQERDELLTVANEEKETDEIKAAREWLFEQKPNSEYIHNLQIIAKQSHIKYNMFGFWTSMVAAYQRAAEKLKEAERVKKVNEYVDGEIKDRKNFIVTVTRRTGFNSQFGYVNVISMLTDDGITLTWMANTSPDMDTGCKYEITGTIKKFEIYNDWKQTHLSRVKVNKAL